MATLRKGILSAPRGRIGNTVGYRQNGKDVIRANNPSQIATKKINKSEYGKNLKLVASVVKNLPVDIWGLIKEDVGDKGKLLAMALKKNKSNTVSNNTRFGYRYALFASGQRQVAKMRLEERDNQFFVAFNYGNSEDVIETEDTLTWGFLLREEDEEIVLLLYRRRKTGNLFTNSIRKSDYAAGYYVVGLIITDTERRYKTDLILVRVYNPGV